MADKDAATSEENSSGSSQVLDYTQIQEDSLDESQGTTEDLNYTLQEEMALRKNLDNAFLEAKILECACSEKPERASIKQRIAHFEQQLAENSLKNSASSASSTKTTVSRPPPVPSKAGDTSGKSRAYKQQLKVFARIRPCPESEDSDSILVVSPNKASGQLHPTTIRTNPVDEAIDASKTRVGKKDMVKEFVFSQVFGKDSTQKEVYEKTAAPLVNGLCTANRVGESALLFSYGITNAGKTYTVLGDSRNHQSSKDWGIVPRCLMQVLQKVSNTDLKVWLSYFEIYNENIFDLLPKGSSSGKNNSFQINSTKPLKIRERLGQIVIKGLTKYQIDSLDLGLEVVKKAKENRHKANNHLNRNSSRSHCVCQLSVAKISEQEADGDDDKSVDTATLFSSRPEDSATLWIVDLAGSERSKRTNVGKVRQQEAAFINKSLMTLMGCLTRGEKNFRDSKLTVLFAHHWMKAGATSMIVNVNPNREDFDENLHVLSYAISSKSIPNPERKNMPSLACSNYPEYGYDGHRKTTTATSDLNRNRKQVEKNKAPGAKMAVMRKRKSNLSTLPLELKPFRIEKQPGSSIFEAASTADPPTKKQKHSNDGNDHDAALRQELKNAKSQIEELQAKNQALEQKLETAETAVRAEVAEEMLQEMTSMTQRYESQFRELKAKAVQPNDGDDLKSKLDRAKDKIQELEEQVKECEEEMLRTSEAHSEEQRRAAETTAVKDELIAGLQKTLEECQCEISKLKTSKAELVKSYEKLLLEGDEEDDEPPRPQARGRQYKERSRCKTEPRVRRPLAIKGTTVTKPLKVIGPNDRENVSLQVSTTDQTAGAQLKPRTPFADRPANICPTLSDCAAKDPWSASKFIYPTQKTGTDPGTGTFLCSRGAAPPGTSESDDISGA